MNTLSAADIQALRDIAATHIRAGLAADWEVWTATCADDVVLLPPGAAQVDGRVAAKKWLEGFPTITAFEGVPRVIRGSTDLAFTTGSGSMTLTLDGKPTPGRFKWLAVFHKQADGNWRMLADMWNEEAAQ
jgi:ketosteroid isomerase-like protein